MRRTLAAFAALCLGGGGAQPGTHEFNVGDYARHLKEPSRVNTFKCGGQVWRVVDPELLRARGVITATNTVTLRLPWRPETWHLSEGYRGKTLPLLAAEVVYGNGARVERVLAGKPHLRHDRRQQELSLTLRMNPDTVRGVVGQVMTADRSCSARILFTVSSFGPG